MVTGSARATGYMLDSSVCISILRGRISRSDLPVRANVTVSSIVAAELWTGAEKSARPETKKAVTELLAIFAVADFDAEAARHYGAIRAELERKGTPIGPLDLLIAAHARSRRAVLVSGNVREFKRVKGLKTVAWR